MKVFLTSIQFVLENPKFLIAVSAFALVYLVVSSVVLSRDGNK